MIFGGIIDDLRLEIILKDNQLLKRLREDWKNEKERI
jgi:hypothetical protein